MMETTLCQWKRLTIMGEDKWSIESTWVFREKRYAVCADVREDVLVVQVTDGLSGDRWRGQFDPKHIEELTRKTGNYKKFPTFLNMLESAVTKSSEAVTLDLLSYMDLEAMWEKKLGSNKKQRLSEGAKPESKRYLILTYSVEFDRIHYPLALSYFGSPNPILLQETIKTLQAQLDKAVDDDEVSILRQENAILLEEKERLEEDFLEFQREAAMHKEGGKEVIILKKVIKNMEEEALREHAKHKKCITKKNEEIKVLLQEIEDLQLSEKLLKSKVKTLTKEITNLKQGARFKMQQSGFKGSFHSNSSERVFRSNSIKKARTPSSKHGCNLLKTRTPSPRISRFDPTAYIEKKKKLQLERKLHSRLRSNSFEILKRGNQSSSRTSYLTKSRQPRSRSSSVDNSRGHRASPFSRVSSSSSLLGSKGHTITPKGTNDKNMDSISEIDARLNALQEFMRKSLESAQ